MLPCTHELFPQLIHPSTDFINLGCYKEYHILNCLNTRHLTCHNYELVEAPHKGAGKYLASSPVPSHCFLVLFPLCSGVSSSKHVQVMASQSLPSLRLYLALVTFLMSPSPNSVTLRVMTSTYEVRIST
jgi:hypothetical protein